MGTKRKYEREKEALETVKKIIESWEDKFYALAEEKVKLENAVQELEEENERLRKILQKREGTINRIKNEIRFS